MNINQLTTPPPSPRLPVRKDKAVQYCSHTYHLHPMNSQSVSFTYSVSLSRAGDSEELNDSATARFVCQKTHQTAFRIFPQLAQNSLIVTCHHNLRYAVCRRANISRFTKTSLRFDCTFKTVVSGATITGHTA